MRAPTIKAVRGPLQLKAFSTTKRAVRSPYRGVLYPYGAIGSPYGGGGGSRGVSKNIGPQLAYCLFFVCSGAGKGTRSLRQRRNLRQGQGSRRTLIVGGGCKNGRLGFAPSLVGI